MNNFIKKELMFILLFTPCGQCYAMEQKNIYDSIQIKIEEEKENADQEMISIEEYNKIKDARDQALVFWWEEEVKRKIIDEKRMEQHQLIKEAEKEIEELRMELSGLMLQQLKKKTDEEEIQATKIKNVEMAILNKLKIRQKNQKTDAENIKDMQIEIENLTINLHKTKEELVCYTHHYNNVYNILESKPLCNQGCVPREQVDELVQQNKEMVNKLELDYNKTVRAFCKHP